MLHIINKSPFSSRVFEQAYKLIQPSDVVIFVDDACYALQGPHPLLEQLTDQGVTINAIREHVETRGLACDSSFLISMTDFVDITFEQDKNMSWY